VKEKKNILADLNREFGGDVHVNLTEAGLLKFDSFLHIYTTVTR